MCLCPPDHFANLLSIQQNSIVNVPNLVIHIEKEKDCSMIGCFRLILMIVSVVLVVLVYGDVVTAKLHASKTLDDSNELMQSN